MHQDSKQNTRQYRKHPTPSRKRCIPQRRFDLKNGSQRTPKKSQQPMISARENDRDPRLQKMMDTCRGWFRIHPVPFPAFHFAPLFYKANLHSKFILFIFLQQT